MTPVEAVARALYRRKYAHRHNVDELVERHWRARFDDACVAIEALAANVSDKQVEAFSRVKPAEYFPLSKWAEQVRRALSAAIAAAQS